MPWKEGTVHIPKKNDDDSRCHPTRFCVIIDSPEYDEQPTSDDEVTDSDVLYQDRFCKLSQSALILKWYFFPTGQQKRISISSIQSIEQIRDSSRMVAWGVRDNIWWNYDPSRNIRKKINCYFAIRCGHLLPKGFTVRQPLEFVSQLKTLRPDLDFSHFCIKTNEQLSED